MWAVVTPTLVWYTILPSRARYVATSLVGEQFSGILVSDRYAVYDYVDADKRQVTLPLESVPHNRVTN